MESLRVVTTYDDLGKELIKCFKFEGNQAAGRICAEYMAELVSDIQIDIIVVASTTPARRRQRGFDQAELLAKHISRKLAIPYIPVLVRTKNVHQIGMGREERLAQAQDLYTLTNYRAVRNQRVLLIDDVVTTGATLHSAAQTLQAAGVASIVGLAFARD